MGRSKIITDKKAQNIIKMIEECIIRKHRLPMRILSDQGFEVDINTIREYFKTKGIDWNHSSPYHHKTVGAVERAIQSFMNIIRKTSNFGSMKWEDT